MRWLFDRGIRCGSAFSRTKRNPLVPDRWSVPYIHIFYNQRPVVL
jgi:hypothetical protein